MAAQLDKILEGVRQDKVTVQIVPFDAGAYAAADGYFVLLEFGEASLPPVVFVEGLTKNQYLEHMVDIARYREVIENLRDSALSPRDSLSYVAEIRKSYIDE